MTNTHPTTAIAGVMDVDALAEAFDRDGYVVVPGLLTDIEIDPSSNAAQHDR